MEFREGAREIKLVRKPKLIADGFDGQIRAIEQLHRALHPQVIQVHQRRVTRNAVEQIGVVGARQIHHGGQCGDTQRLAQMLFHELNALGDAILYVRFAVPELILVSEDDTHQMRERMRGIGQMRQCGTMFETFENVFKK